MQYECTSCDPHPLFKLGNALYTAAIIFIADQHPPSDNPSSSNTTKFHSILRPWIQDSAHYLYCSCWSWTNQCEELISSCGMRDSWCAMHSTLPSSFSTRGRLRSDGNRTSDVSLCVTGALTKLAIQNPVFWCNLHDRMICSKFKIEF